MASLVIGDEKFNLTIGQQNYAENIDGLVAIFASDVGRSVFTGMMNKLFRQDVASGELAPTLYPVLEHYAREREESEHFGDFVIRAGYVAATLGGPDFHSNVKPEAVTA